MVSIRKFPLTTGTVPDATRLCCDIPHHLHQVQYLRMVEAHGEDIPPQSLVVPVRVLENLAWQLGEGGGHRSCIGKFLHHSDGEQLERQSVRIRLQSHPKQKEERERAKMGNGDGDNWKIHHEDLGIPDSRVSRYWDCCTGDGRGDVEFDGESAFEKSDVNWKHQRGKGGVLASLRGGKDVCGHVGIANYLHVKGGPSIASRMRSWPHIEVMA